MSLISNQTRFWKLQENDLDRILCMLQLPEGARVLDIGCGTGFLCIRLSERGFDVVGIDKHSASIITAKNNRSAVCFSNVAIEDYRSGLEFDLSVFMLSLALMNNQLEALRIAKKLSKKLLVITPIRKPKQQLSLKQRVISVDRDIFFENSIQAGFMKIETLESFFVEEMLIEAFLLI